MRCPLLPRLLLLGGAVGACSFEEGALSIDARVDVMPDIIAPPVLPASCKAILDAQPSTGSGRFMIDPDGDAGAPPFLATCDMSTEGGGWTIVFFPGTPNVLGVPTSYTSATPRLLQDATRSLVAYRTSMQAVVVGTDIASFPLPADWRTAPPFTYARGDANVDVSVNGGPPFTRLLRYGRETFASTCADSWFSSDAWGRICIVGTTAPYYTGFAVADADTCPNSAQVWNASSCGNERRFSIAVR